jgi:hypothetical protein
MFDVAKLTKLQRTAALHPFTNDRGRPGPKAFTEYAGGYVLGLSLNR